MTTAIAPARITEEEFLQMDHSGFELVDGHLEENPMSWETAWIAGEIHRRMANFAIEHGLGTIFPQETGFAGWPSSPGMIRKPDVMFVRTERMPAAGMDTGWCPVAPDLAIEVVSPNDRVEALERKLADYQEAGVPLVWVIYPAIRAMRVYRGTDPVERIGPAGRLAGEDILPGFSVDVADVLEQAARQHGPLSQD